MSGLRVDYTKRELLENHPVAEPLIAGGVRCHGGFDETGNYVSPRTKNRWPAIRAWQEQRQDQFATPLRDVAFDSPLTEDQTQTMMDRMFGYGATAGSAASTVGPMFPDVDQSLEVLIQSMARLLLIEISAHHVFAWAEEVLADNELVAGDGAASRLVSYIRADEAPHVEYLKTTLSELRDRTFVTERDG